MNLKEKITNLREDKRGVSPVIGVIMMIAIVVIIAAVVAAFAYGIIGGVNKAPSTALVVEGVKASASAVDMKIFHHGGDTITAAFNDTAVGNGEALSNKWANLEVKLNGATVGTSSTAKDGNGDGNVTAGGDLTGLTMNGTHFDKSSWKPHFQSGDMMTVTFCSLTTEDTIIILHVPSESILQRVTVM